MTIKRYREERYEKQKHRRREKITRTLSEEMNPNRKFKNNYTVVDSTSDTWLCTKPCANAVHIATIADAFILHLPFVPSMQLQWCISFIFFFI